MDHMKNGRFDDKLFLEDTAAWPKMSDGFMRYCCLKNGREHAFILSGDNPQGMQGEIIVSEGDVFSGGTGRTFRFESLDALLEEGWLVD